MPSFRTTLPPFDPGFQVNHSSQILCMGSCFAEHMAARLSHLKLKCHINPYGILYHPITLANCLSMCLDEYSFTQMDLVMRDKYWYSLWHHSEITNQSSEILLAELHEIQNRLLGQIKSSNVFIFTFGSAYYYQHISTGIDVGNCHKISANAFQKKRATSDSIVNKYKSVISKIKVLNQNAKFIFTVSPVRHVKDGIVENSRSKAILNLAIDKLVEEFDQAFYFPAFEIMMDDLRDYRFYASDLLHPSEVAIDYVWEKFSEHLFSEKSKELNKRISAIQNAVNHKPFQPNSTQHQSFVKNNLKQIDSLEREYPELNFANEKNKLLAILV